MSTPNAPPQPPPPADPKKTQRLSSGDRSRTPNQPRHPHELPNITEPTDLTKTPAAGDKRPRSNTDTSLTAEDVGGYRTNNSRNTHPAQNPPTNPPDPAHQAEALALQQGVPNNSAPSANTVPATAPNPHPLTDEKRRAHIALLEELKEKEANQAKSGEPDDRSTFVPKPQDGFPIVHRAHPSDNLDNVSGATYEEWISEDPNAVIAIPHFLNSWSPGKSTVVATLIKAAVKSFLNLESLYVAHAAPAHQSSDERAGPHAFALLHMPPHAADTLIERGCLANDDIAINFYPSDHLSPTTYIGYIDNLSNLEEPQALDKLKVNIRTAFHSSVELSDAILDHIRST